MRHLLVTLGQALLGEICYQICERLDGYSARATSRQLATTAAALAAYASLDVERLLNESELRNDIARPSTDFTPAEWKRILSIARAETRLREIELWSEGPGTTL